MSAAQGQQAPRGAPVPGPTRPRRGPLLLVACLTALVLLLLAGTVGGFTYLLLDRRAEEASRTTYATEYYSFAYPSAWHEVSSAHAEPAEEQVLTVENAEETRRLVLLDRRDGTDAESSCEMHTIQIESQGLGTHQNEVVGTEEVGGREALHHRAVARGLSGEFSSTVLESWCMDTPEGSVVLIAQALSEDEDAQTMPEAEQIVAGWTWTPHDELE